MDATIVHTVGTRVWIKDEKEACITGELIRVEDDYLLVRTEANGLEVKCKPEDAPLQNPHNDRGVDVSGESGAGKTETSKLIMKYLAYMGGYTEAGERAGIGSSVEEQVLESNPLLEAFGNAKTARNNNSSRFGKYTEINFNTEGVISGAATRTYLLERSRVVAINNPERNYHIFYQLIDGAVPEQRAALRLKPSNYYHYLNQSSCFELPGTDDAEEFKRTLHAMERVGIAVEDREAILRTVAAILHLGNITFSAGPEDRDSSLVTPVTEESLEATSELLGVEKDGLRKALTTRVRQTPEGPIVSPLDAHAAAETRDSLAKIIYAKIFDWLVQRVNSSIGEDKKCAASVGVLDMCGFEQFRFNDFEQLCINYGSEKLQQHFNQHTFKMVQAVYAREQIDWSYIQFKDNQDVLDLLEGKLGVLALLDEVSRFIDAKGKNFAEKLYSAGSCKDSGRFSKPKTSMTQFIVDHYAGPVTYDTDHFIEKNRDFLVPEYQAMLGSSSQSFIAALFTDTNAAPAALGHCGAPQGVKFNSVGNQFKKQLAELMVQLHTMQPHYIRCIKPNESAQPGVFENKNVLHQLKCGGVMEAVRISCAGFPSRPPYDEFVDHFWQLAPHLLKTEVDDKEVTKAILRKAGVSGYQMGVTRVFMRPGQMAHLEKMRTDTLNGAAITIQRFMRGALARRRYTAARAAVLTIQYAVRAWVACKLASQLRREKTALTIQRMWRGCKARSTYLEHRRLAASVHSMSCGRNVRQGMAQLRAAINIQRCWRGFVARRSFLETRKAAMAVQNGLENMEQMQVKLEEVSRGRIEETQQQVAVPHNSMERNMRQQWLTDMQQHQQLANLAALQQVRPGLRSPRQLHYMKPTRTSRLKSAAQQPPAKSHPRPFIPC